MGKCVFAFPSKRLKAQAFDSSVFLQTGDLSTSAFHKLNLGIKAIFTNNKNMENKHTKQDTANFIYGSWSALDGEKKYLININKEITQLIIIENGQKITHESFDTSPHWLNEDSDFLYYFHTNKYFISFANENELRFGELLNPPSFNGKYRFYLKFKRV